MAENINLNSMSLSELKALHKQVAKAIENFEDRKKRDALNELEVRAREMGFSLGELVGSGGSEKKVRAKARARYAHPENPSMTWSGRGRKPQWFADALAAGKTPEDLTV